MRFLSCVTDSMIKQSCSPSLRYMKNFALSLTGSITGVIWFKQRLQEQYKELIFFTNHPGKRSTVCFKDIWNKFINDKQYPDWNGNFTNERTRIIIARAKLIQGGARSKKFDIKDLTIKDLEFETAILPPSLELFMKLKMVSQLKKASFGQCIFKAMRSKSVMLTSV